MWRDVRWITNALQYARYKQPLGWVPITWLVDVSMEPPVQKNDSTSSNTDYVPTPSPSPQMRRRKPTIGKCCFSIAAFRPGINICVVLDCVSVLHSNLYCICSSENIAFVDSIKKMFLQEIHKCIGFIIMQHTYCCDKTFSIKALRCHVFCRALQGVQREESL